MVEAGFVLSADLDQLGIEIVQFGCEVGGGSGGHAMADAAAIDDDHRAAEAAQLVGGREAGDPGADNDDVASLVRRERRRVDHRSFVHPTEMLRSSPTFICFSAAYTPLRAANGPLRHGFRFSGRAKKAVTKADQTSRTARTLEPKR
jgi:hypothetical protein